ncbi:MAG: hypothetical protein KKG47_03680 [Proteobacteria bacterium]|nr:hypothetical protein [Pseudomonadota bacterium]
MKLRKTMIGGVACLFLVSALPVSLFAMPGMNHSTGKDSTAGMAMASTATAIMLQTDLQEGVKAMAHLKDIKAAMAEYGSKETHHFMVQFSTEGDGQSLDTGLAAVKVVDPEGKELDPRKMMAMDGSFGVDVALNMKGKYQFEVGTKLKDGKKRVFRFHYENLNG